MTPQDISTLAIVTDFIQATGTVGILVIIGYAFYTGRVVPRQMLDQMLAEADNRTTKLVEELRAGIRQAVRDGILDAERERGGRRGGVM